MLRSVAALPVGMALVAGCGGSSTASSGEVPPVDGLAAVAGDLEDAHLRIDELANAVDGLSRQLSELTSRVDDLEATVEDASTVLKNIEPGLDGPHRSSAPNWPT